MSMKGGGGFERKSKASEEIPSSSLADIAFLLLIFFMVTTVFPTDQERPIDWVYQDDVAEGLAKLAVTPGVEGRTVDIGSGEAVTVRGIVELLAETIGGPGEPRFGARASRAMEQVEVAEVEETRELLGWAPQTSLEEGLRRTVDWYETRRS